MQRIKIGILDGEKEYVTNLCAYLQRYGKNKWDVKAFTKEDLLMSYINKKQLDILIGTDRKSLIRAKGETPLVRMWLADQTTGSREKEENIHEIYRFQSAEKIGQYVEGIVRQECIRTDISKQLVAVYSPVGRCGKTTLALELVQSEMYGKWVYLGMEDYSSFRSEEGCRNNVMDEMMYYWKERRSEKMLELMEKNGNVIGSGSSFLDIRQINEEDLRWIRDVLQNNIYQGVIFDIGTGVLQDFLIFKEFHHVLVPYVDEPQALLKIEKFKALFEIYEMEDYRERISYLNMNQKQEVMESIQKIFEGELW